MRHVTSVGQKDPRDSYITMHVPFSTTKRKTVQMKQQRICTRYWEAIKETAHGAMMVQFIVQEQRAPGVYSTYHLHGSNKGMR